MRKCKDVKRIVIIIIVLAVVLIPVLLLVIHKPARVIIPEVIGFNRVDKGLYIDDMKRMEEARLLRNQALEEMNNEFGQFKNEPKMLFCSLQQIFEKLGFKKSASRSVGTYGIVIGPRAWAKYYIKHELIHYWQAENLGMIKMNYYPQWLIEGMAYSLSDDPRTTLDEPWETYREEFNNWYKQIDKNDLLIEIKAIGQESR
jgi:hypothetical protein